MSRTRSNKKEAAAVDLKEWQTIEPVDSISPTTDSIAISKGKGKGKGRKQKVSTTKLIDVSSIIVPVSPVDIKQDAGGSSSPQRADTRKRLETTPVKGRDKSSTIAAVVTPASPVSHSENLADSINASDPSPSPGGGFHRTALIVKPRVEKVYKMVRKSTGALGGNGYVGAIYGELTMHSMQRVINFMVDKCELSRSSRFIDVGSGLGKPNFHASQDPCVRLSLGIELEDIRWKLAMHNLHQVLEEVEESPIHVHDVKMKKKAALPLADISALKLHGGVNFMLGDIDEAHSMDPFTHIYMFDLGFPPPLQASIAAKFNKSVHGRYLVSYRPPHRVIHEYGYAVDFIEQFATSMHGSGESHTAYFYRRNNIPPKSSQFPEHTSSLLIPGRADSLIPEEDETVFCDNAFLHSSALAVGPLSDLREYARDENRKHMNSGRPIRQRKPKIF